MLRSRMSPFPRPPQAAAMPQRVLLFSGHRVDAPRRAVPRFPPSMVASAAQGIEAELEALRAGPADLAITQGAAGGDLLFAHACQERGVPLRLMLPMDEPRFVRRAVAGSAQPRRWQAAWRHVRERLAEPPRQLPPDRAAQGDPFERCNDWMLEHALAVGAPQVLLLCLWDGAPGDGPGGTADLVAEARRQGIPVRWIDARALR